MGFLVVSLFKQVSHFPEIVLASEVLQALVWNSDVSLNNRLVDLPTIQENVCDLHNEMCNSKTRI